MCFEHDHYKMECIWSLLDIDLELLMEYFKYSSAVRRSRISPFPPSFCLQSLQWCEFELNRNQDPHVNGHKWIKSCWMNI